MSVCRGDVEHKKPNQTKTYMPKKVIIRLLTILAVIFASIFVAKLIGGFVFSFVAAGLLTFVVEFVAVALIAMFGFGPIGTKSPSPRNGLVIVAVICVLASLALGGLAGLVGGVAGTFATLIYFRGAL